MYKNFILEMIARKLYVEHSMTKIGDIKLNLECGIIEFECEVTQHGLSHPHSCRYIKGYMYSSGELNIYSSKCIYSDKEIEYINALMSR